VRGGRGGGEERNARRKYSDSCFSRRIESVRTETVSTPRPPRIPLATFNFQRPNAERAPSPLPVSISRQIAAMQRQGQQSGARERDPARRDLGKLQVRAPHEPRAGPGSPCGPPLRLAATSSLLRARARVVSLSLSLSTRRRSLLSSTNINLGRLHLYLMLPISRLIPPLPAALLLMLSLLAERPPPGGIERAVRHAALGRFTRSTPRPRIYRFPR